MRIRTRFAPSPTGFLHIGNVRTALYAWLYARHHQGEFILRIEDTDEARSTQTSVDAILSGLTWLGLSWDEGPYYQTDRYPRYQACATQLLEQGQAYYCHCSKSRLETLRASQLSAKKKPRYDGHCRHLGLPKTPDAVVRFKNPETGSIDFHDEVYGAIEIQNQELDDLVLIRSDGHPTYNFAVVVDDWDMQMTHVIRGDDHLNNTPRQIQLYRALGAPLPVFAHLPIILGPDGKRFSKRHGAVSLGEFKAAGILPQALLNYLVRLGWSHQDQEIFSLEEMITLFDLTHITRGVSSFNHDKLYWLNQHYQKMQTPDVVTALAACFEAEHIDCSQGPRVSDVLRLQAERYPTLLDIVQHSHYFYQDTIQYDAVAVEKHLTMIAQPVLMALHEALEALAIWDAKHIHDVIQSVCQTLGLGMGKVAQPLRVAVTGTTQSPSIDETLALIGRSRGLARLASVLSKIHT